jgi:hypothetical protein
MEQVSPLHAFSENTKFTCMIISISIILLIFTSASNNIVGNKKTLLLKFFGIIILCYALFINYRETNNLVKTVPDIFINENLTKVRNNALLSYILCIMLLLFVLYMTYTLFF